MFYYFLLKFYLTYLFQTCALLKTAQQPTIPDGTKIIVLSNMVDEMKSQIVAVAVFCNSCPYIFNRGTLLSRKERPYFKSNVWMKVCSCMHEQMYICVHAGMCV